MAPWRWWDGAAWTVHVAGNEMQRRLPEWLSVPVLLSLVFAIPMFIVFAVVAPVSVALGLVPIVIVLPVMLWLDRVEPEPRSALVHAFLWGATISILVSGTVNSMVVLTAGETAGVVLSAPLVEEAMKGLGVLYALRRKEIDGVMDGIVYAGWVALGFAVVEDISYFAQADDGGVLAQTFVVRALLGPFAHPLFTMWIGLAIGRAVSRGNPVFPNAIWGYGVAVASHALWNGSLVATATWGESGALLFFVAVIVFVVLFFSSAFVLYRVRRQEERRLIQLVPWLADRYGLDASEIAPFGDFKAMLSTRRKLAKDERERFDVMHAALARLTVLHDRPGPTDQATEQVLIGQLNRARVGRR